MPYCIINDNQVVSGPQERPSNYNGVRNFHNLPEDQLSQYGWYPAVLVNNHYDPKTQIRSEPKFSFDGSVVTVTYTVSYKPIDSVKQQKIEEIYRIYEQKQSEGVIVNTSTGKTFDMDSKMGDPQTLRDGIQLLTMLNDPNITMVITDRNNVNHPDITLSEANEILVQQGIYVMQLRATKNQLRDQINNCQTIEEIEAIEWI